MQLMTKTAFEHEPQLPVDGVDSSSSIAVFCLLGRIIRNPASSYHR